jgi:23S rRNA U2552 (ribose-2'-O)-methylase RlmE/FtsJ
MKEIEELFYISKNNSIKWKKYFEVYNEFFKPFRNKNITFVEIGIHNGGSLEIWKNYFGEKSRIIGIDVNPQCKIFEKDGYEIFIGNQSDPKFWHNFFKEVGKVDIILDDGGHTNLDQIITTVNVVDKINDNGLLVIEDVHTSYIEEYNSNIKFSFINFTKELINKINSNKDSEFKKLIYSIHYFDKIVIFRINRDKCKFEVAPVSNSGQNNNVENLTWLANELNINFIKWFFSKIPFFSFRKITKIIKNRINNNKIKKYFD